MTLRRRTPLRPSRGTQWPASVREHVATHQPRCLGPLTDPPMPGECSGWTELDHVRASLGIGMKSDSIATNAARLCSSHHRLKGQAGKTWRPRLLTVIARLASECSACQRESISVYGVPLDEGAYLTEGERA